ncbi:prenyltransferase/squalene oxidase repeat-containing protein [Komagataeibacter rhaeticus]|nr:prenyltransferase/squalene oxidase repeat-containing protein [Komagataeibacter rhaeticus]
MNKESRPFPPGTTGPVSGKAPQATDGSFRALDNSLSHALSAACDWLIGQQKPDGHWVGPVASNASMEAEWCLALWFLGLDDHPLRPRLGHALLEMQREDGSWGIYYGAGNGDINATVESYAALRSLGYAADEPALAKAATWIASKGAAQHPGVHPLLAGADRGMAMGEDAQPAAGSHLVSQQIRLFHL